jgi:hypothetical protein
MSETEEQICVCCSAIREEVSEEPVGRGYELRTLLCLQCKTVLKFVEPIKGIGGSPRRARPDALRMQRIGL